MVNDNIIIILFNGFASSKMFLEYNGIKMKPELEKLDF